MDCHHIQESILIKHRDVDVCIYTLQLKQNPQ